MLTTRFALLDPATLREHEEVETPRVRDLAERIRQTGVVHRPIVVDEASHVVLDGHHRLAALRRLGCRLVPVHLVDYQDGTIVVDAWREDVDPPTKEEIVRRAREGELFEPKTTRHLHLRHLGDVPVRLLELQVDEA